MAIASGGGHWKQLMLIAAAFEDCDVYYVTTIQGLPEENNIAQFSIVKDSNKKEPWNLLVCLIQIIFCFFRYKPDIVISTGAAPGLLGLAVARLLGKKTIWLDSIANGNELSLGGKLSQKFAHKVFTQWPELANDKVEYVGAVF